MSIRAQSGFTIIEVMLFLAVSGVLAAGIMVGMGTALSAQRYKDAVSTFQSDIQQQYEDITSIKNNRTDGGDGVCSGARGTSDCVLLGKVMAIEVNGKKHVANVYGDERLAETGVDDYTALRSYTPKASEVDRQDSRMEWDTGISAPVGETSNGVTILVVRSPQTGSTHTFTRNGIAMNDLGAMIGDEYIGQRVMCVSPAGWSVGETLAVFVSPRAASANGVEVRSAEMMAQEGMRC